MRSLTSASLTTSPRGKRCTSQSRTTSRFLRLDGIRTSVDPSTKASSTFCSKDPCWASGTSSTIRSGTSRSPRRADSVSASREYTFDVPSARTDTTPSSTRRVR